MSKITIQQGAVKATLGEVCYHGAEGFQESNTWHVAEAVIRAELDPKISSGPAQLHRDGKTYPVIVEVLQFVEEPEDEIEDEPACEIEIKPIEGKLAQLAIDLGLLDHYSNKQKAGLLASS